MLRVDPNTWDLEFVGKSERPWERVLAQVSGRGFESVDKVEGYLLAGLVAATGGCVLDLGCCEQTESCLHRNSGVGLGLVS